MADISVTPKKAIPALKGLLNPRDKGVYQLGGSTDWAVMTPWGTINPRSNTVVRKLRERKDILAKLSQITE